MFSHRRIKFYMMQIHSWSQNYPPPVTKVTFLDLETLETLFEKNFLNKKCLFSVGQHFSNIFLLRKQIATKNIKCEKLELLLSVVAT